MAEPVANGVEVENINLEVKSDEDIVKPVEEATKPEENHTSETAAVMETKGIACTLAPADDYVTNLRDGAVKIRFSEKNNGPTISVMEFIERTCNTWPNRPALKVERQEQWVTWTYKEYLQDIRTTAKGFIKVNIRLLFVFC